MTALKAPLALLLLCGTAAAAPPRAVMVVAAPGLDDAARDAARAQLARRFALVDDPALREALEQFRRSPSADELVRSALERAHQKMRRFDLAGVKQELDAADAAADELAPTPSSRALAAEVAVRRLEAAQVEGDRAQAEAAADDALAADPSLTPDPAREPPKLVQAIEAARVRQKAAPSVAVTVTSEPSGARLYVGGLWRGETPLTVEVPAGRAMLWLQGEGRRDRRVRFFAKAGAKVEAQLPALDARVKLEPLVEAVRRSGGEARREAALALAAALGVDAVAVVEAGAAPSVFERVVAAPPAPVVSLPSLSNDQRIVAAPTEKRPWYKRGWVWGLIVGSALVAGGVAGVAGYFGQPERVNLTCCR